jgi:uncharacterized caspase-like protein
MQSPMHIKVALFALTLLAVSVPADAKRLALVIGNDSYRHADPLRNARADARSVADALKATNFRVTLKQDLTLQAMKETIRTFKNEVSGGDEVIFYYSGHGVQLEGNNYMVPVDTAGESPDQLRDDSVSLQRVLDDMEDQRAKFTLAIIDACRDNPFKGNGRAIRSRGLAPVTAADGQAVLYSAGAGQEALDSLGAHDTDPNGVFTRVLIKEMKTPGLSFDQVIHEVRNQVVQLARSVNHNQTPGYYSQFTGDFYFLPPTAGQPARVPAPTATTGNQAAELAAFRAAEATNTVSGWQIFKRNYPGSEYAVTADIRLATLTQPRTPKIVQAPTQATISKIDPAVVGSFEYDKVIDDYDWRVVYTIAPDGTWRLVTTQEENGNYQSANGRFRTVGARTGRTRTGTYRAVSHTAIEVTGATGPAIFQPTQPISPLDQKNPVMLGVWRASVVQGAMTWILTLQNNPDGTYRYQGRVEDRGSGAFSGQKWNITSAVTGNSSSGSYRVIDANNIEIASPTGTAVWKRR